MGRRPFSSQQHTASFVEDRWQWGEYDPASPDGFSAMVSFNADGSDPIAKIWLTADSIAALEIMRRAALEIMRRNSIRNSIITDLEGFNIEVEE